MSDAMPQFAARERRYRILWLTADVLLSVLMSPRREGERIQCLTAQGLPDGVEIETVDFDHLRGMFGFRLWHPSFDVVPPGEFIPPADVTFGLEWVATCQSKTCADVRAQGTW